MLSVWYDDEIELSGVGLAAGKRGDRTHLVIMKAADPVVGMIGLLQFTEPPLPGACWSKRSLGIGDIGVRPCRATTCTACTSGRCRPGPASTPHRIAFEVRGADGRELSMTSLSLWYPDDYFIEFNQRHGR